jgi:hypothetical protein
MQEPGGQGLGPGTDMQGQSPGGEETSHGELGGKGEDGGRTETGGGDREWWHRT